ncbi:hypothetical protein AHAS_Ahas10G0156100 [Arachis hypogaea]
MLRGWFIGVWWGLLVTTRGSTITIVLACIMGRSLSVVPWKVLLPKGLIRSSWLLPSLIFPTLMAVLIVISSSCNIIVTRIIAKGVRVHSSERK